MKKITLYLMTQKGYNVLESIIQNDLHALISEVIVGRDTFIENDFSEEIKYLCESNKVPCYERSDQVEIQTDYSLAISWKWLIAENNSKLIVIHDSILPKYRGFAPLVNMLINKEQFIGVTAIFAAKEYDRGEILFQSKRKIEYPIRISQAIDLVVENYIELVLKIVSTIKDGKTLKGQPQNEQEATYSLWRDEEDYKINWNDSSENVLNFINAVSAPYKGASAQLNGQKVRILEAEIFPDVEIVNRDAGKVIFVENGLPVIVCQSGLLKLVKVIEDSSGKNMLPLKKFRSRFI
jgi:methionyl-tRNA formyltransferase